jgi:mycothiol system anti-sigma-R factor
MNRVITCSEAVEQLWAFLDDELHDHEEQAVEAHLAFCRRCCGEMEFAKHLRQLLARRSSTDLPADVRARLDGFVDELADAASEGGTP